MTALLWAQAKRLMQFPSDSVMHDVQHQFI